MRIWLLECTSRSTLYAAQEIPSRMIRIGSVVVTGFSVVAMTRFSPSVHAHLFAW